MTKRKMLTHTLLFVLLSLIVEAQTSTKESPISFRHNSEMFRTNVTALKTMPSINLEALRTEDEIEEQFGVPPRFGYPHSANLNLENTGEWFELQDGDKLWKLEISCPGALSINLCYDKFWLPDGAKFFVYSANRKHSIGAFYITEQQRKQRKTTGLCYRFSLWR